MTLWREVRIPNIFTLEASFCGCECDGNHLTCGQLMKIGRDLCRSLISGFDIKYDPARNINYSAGNSSMMAGNQDFLGSNKKLL